MPEGKDSIDSPAPGCSSIFRALHCWSCWFCVVMEAEACTPWKWAILSTSFLASFDSGDREDELLLLLLFAGVIDGCGLSSSSILIRVPFACSDLRHELLRGSLCAFHSFSKVWFAFCGSYVRIISAAIGNLYLPAILRRLSLSHGLSSMTKHAIHLGHSPRMFSPALGVMSQTPFRFDHEHISC